MTAERRRALAVLGLLSVLFVGYAAVFTRHLTNNHLGDVEFTGWSNPFASRWLHGERPYVDFVLPIPSGSFALLALFERISGRSLLLHELWLDAGCQLCMALSAYAIAVRVSTRQNALLIALCSLVTVLLLNKECAYDETALALAWAGAALGAKALFDLDGPARRRTWALTGFCAGFVLWFKQSTGVGTLLGWGTALAYLWTVERVSGVRAVADHRRRDALAWASGAALGVAATLLGVAALGSPLGAFVQAVFLDGPELKGGTWHLLRDLWRYVTTYDAYPVTPLIALGLALLGARVVRRSGGLHVGDEPARDDALSTRQALWIALATLLALGGGAAALLLGYRGVDLAARLWFDRLKIFPMYGFAFGCAFVVAHLRRVEPTEPGTELRRDPLRSGHALNALFVATLLGSLLHNTSAPEFRAFYDNNPVIPVVYLWWFVALDRAQLPGLKVALVLIVIASLPGDRFNRAAQARAPAGAYGHWAGLSVNPRGEDLLRIASHVRALTSDADEVLVLPEDLEIERLIGRPRPALRGGVIYVDQYPQRLLDADLATLVRHPPKVIVLQPKEAGLWMRVFRTWSADSATERMVVFVKAELPKRYAKESSYPTIFLGQASTLEVWVRKE